MNPQPINSTPPAPPTKLSFGCNISLDKKESRKLHRILHPLTRPAHISPNKRVKWRLTKKWFNRYEKQTMVNRIVMARSRSGETYQLRVTDVKICKAGGHRRDYKILAEPI